MPKLTAAEAAQKHMRRLQGATEDIQRGIQGVTTAPGALAAKKQQKMIQRLTEKVNDGTWARNVAAVSLESWKSAALDKGVGRIASGIQAAQPKMEAFYSKLLPFQATIQSKINAMPDLTLEDNIARATTQIREMSKFRK